MEYKGIYNTDIKKHYFLDLFWVWFIGQKEKANQLPINQIKDEFDW